MMTKDPAKAVAEAERYREDGEFATAGEYYAVAGHGYLDVEPPSLPGIRESNAVLQFLLACTACRIAERRTRTENLGRQGALVVADMINRIESTAVPSNDYDHARRGAWYEYLGDFRLVGEFDDPSDAYEAAERVYQAAGDPDSGYAEQEHMRLMSFYNSIAFAVGSDEPEWSSFRHDTTLSEWLSHKRQHLSGVLSAVEARQEWPVSSV